MLQRKIAQNIDAIIGCNHSIGAGHAGVKLCPGRENVQADGRVNGQY